MILYTSSGRKVEVPHDEPTALTFDVFVLGIGIATCTVDPRTNPVEPSELIERAPPHYDLTEHEGEDGFRIVDSDEVLEQTSDTVCLLGALLDQAECRRVRTSGEPWGRGLKIEAERRLLALADLYEAECALLSAEAAIPRLMRSTVIIPGHYWSEQGLERYVEWATQEAVDFARTQAEKRQKQWASEQAERGWNDSALDHAVDDAKHEERS